MGIKKKESNEMRKTLKEGEEMKQEKIIKSEAELLPAENGIKGTEMERKKNGDEM